MFADILGIVIGFISIILLLSILVTALVQTSQVALRLRSRNLMKGVAALIATAREEAERKPREAARESEDTADEPEPKPETPAREPTVVKAVSRLLQPPDPNKRDAMELLNQPNVALIEGVKNPTSPLRYWVFGPRVSWLDPAEVPKAVEDCKEVSDLDPKSFAENFAKIDKPLTRRFKLITRWWTFAWALLIAFGFQVSTPDLVADLQEDTERRQRIEQEAEAILAHTTEALAAISDDTVAPKALEELQRRHTALERQIEEASGVGVNRAFLLEELRLALEDVPEREEIVAEYDGLLDRMAEERGKKAGETIDSTLDLLREYEVVLWKHDWAFYWSSEDGPLWDHILGVLVTAILLSLGAPFWFERLRDTIAMRDALAGATSRVPPRPVAGTASTAGGAGTEPGAAGETTTDS